MPLNLLPGDSPKGVVAAEKKVAAALNEVSTRIESPGVEKGSKLKDRTVKVIKAIKSDLQGAKKTRAENLQKLAAWTKLAEEDNERLLAGTLTKVNAKLKYKDERIFDVKVPEH